MANCLVNCKFDHQDESAGPMTECCTCGKWFHDECLKFPKKAFVPFYACVECVPKLRAVISQSSTQVQPDTESAIQGLQEKFNDITVAVDSLKSITSDIVVKLSEKTYQVEAEFLQKLSVFEARLTDLSSTLSEMKCKSIVIEENAADDICGEPAVILKPAATFASIVKKPSSSKASSISAAPAVHNSAASASGSSENAANNGWRTANSRRRKKKPANEPAPNSAAPSKPPSSIPSSSAIPSRANAEQLYTPTRKKRIFVTAPAKFDTVVLGCSIVRHTAVLNESKGIATVSVPGGIISDLCEVVQMLPSLFATPPLRVMLHCGTNDWDGWASGEQIADRMRELVLRVRKLCPAAKIFVVGLLCRRDSKPADIRDVNFAVSTKLRNLSECFFIDANVRYKTVTWLGRDGLHLNKFGVSTLAKLFVEPFPKNS